MIANFNLGHWGSKQASYSAVESIALLNSAVSQFENNPA
jgi:hypothetical protein